jgi:arsenate reductase
MTRDSGIDPKTLKVTIYHNPDCGTSRNVLALIRNAGVEPKVGGAPHG